MTSGPNWYQIGKKSCYIPLVSKFSVEKRISGLTGLKVSLLARKCIFLKCKNEIYQQSELKGLMKK